MKLLKIMAEYGCHPLWLYIDDKLIDNIDVDETAFSPELKARLKNWMQRYDDTLDSNYPPDSGFTSDEEESEFEKEGYLIWQEIKSNYRSQFDAISYHSAVLHRNYLDEKQYAEDLYHQNHTLFVSGTNKGRRMLLVFVFSLFFVIFILFLLLSFTWYLLVTAVLVFAISARVILSLRQFYDVTIRDGLVIASNIWGTREFKIDDVVRIGLFNFYIPYWHNPFISIEFGSHKIVTKIPGARRVYNAKGGINSYIENLEYRINSSMLNRQ